MTVNTRKNAVDVYVSNMSTTSQNIMRVSPRIFGDTMFYGSRREVVGAVASEWVREGGCVRTTYMQDIPYWSNTSVIEIDLAAIPTSSINAFFELLNHVVLSRHALYETHLVCIHESHLVPKNVLSSLVKSPMVTLVLSTTKPDVESHRQLTGMVRMRVPFFADNRIPCSINKSIDMLGEVKSVTLARQTLHEAFKAGLTSDEIMRACVAKLGMKQEDVGAIANLNHLANICNPPDRLVELAMLTLSIRSTQT